MTTPDPTLSAAILGAVARTRVEADLPAAILAAINETHIVVERAWWLAISKRERAAAHRMSMCAPYGYCTGCQRCSPECVCPDRDAEDRWLDCE